MSLTVVRGRVKKGLGLASGVLAKQIPHFVSRELPRIKKLYQGTLNISIRPREINYSSYDYFFNRVRYENNFSENIGFIKIHKMRIGPTYYFQPGYIYIPHGSPHYENGSVIELLVQHISGIKTNTVVELWVNSNRATIEGSRDKANSNHLPLHPATLKPSWDSSHKAYLNMYVASHFNNLAERIKDLDDNRGRNFSFGEIRPQLIDIVERSRSRVVQISLGFPFPITTLRLRNLLSPPRNSHHLYIWGEPLRTFQRRFIQRYMFDLTIRRKLKFRWVEVGGANKFRYIVERLVARYKTRYRKGLSITYVDPYTYIGDSILGISYFLNFLPKSFQSARRTVFSVAHEHLQTIVDAEGVDQEKLAASFNKSHFALMPDLIDTHLQQTLANLTALIGFSGTILIPGRSLAISTNRRSLTVWHLHRPDPLLRNSNNYDNKQDCMRVFFTNTQSSQPTPHPVAQRSSNIVYINPFGSKPDKMLNVTLVLDICKRLQRREQFPVIIGCLQHNFHHRRWITHFRKKIKRLQFPLKIKFYKNLSILADEMFHLGRCGLITCDSSITHLANYLGVPNVTIFHGSRFDNGSIQSMVSESPLGFASYELTSFPVLLKDLEKVPRTLSQDIVDGMEFLITLANQGFLQKNVRRPVRDNTSRQVTLERYQELAKSLSSHFSWLIRLFDPAFFLNKIPRDGATYRSIERTIIRLSPIYKYFKIVQSSPGFRER